MSASIRNVSDADSTSTEGRYSTRTEEDLSQTPKDDFSTTPRLNLDTVVAELGQFGRFQWRLMGLCGVVAVFASWSASGYLFTAARIGSRCVIPECDPASPEWYPSWVYSAIPTDSAGALDNCQRFTPSNSSLPPIGDTCPAALFDQTRAEDCQDYVYENTYTIAYDFNLACDEWRRTLVGSMRTFGSLLALPLAGYISDRWGRRVALSLAAVAGACVGVTRYWAGTYVGFIILELVESTVGFGSYTSAYILLLEVIDTKYRTATSATMLSCWSMGQMILGLIAWEVLNWKNLTLALYIPQFVSIFYFWIVPESARWYMSKGRYADLEKVLQKIAQTNGKTLNSNHFTTLRQSTEADRQKQESENKKKSNELWLIVNVFRHKKVLLRCIVAPVWWITTMFIYYGLSVNAVNMVGNRYLNFVAVAAVEIPGFWTAVLLVSKIGRKPVLTGGFWICAACQVAYIFIPSDYYGLSLTFYLLGKYAIAIVVKSLYIYTAELYPTKHRQAMFAFTSMIGRIGSIIAPLTPAFGDATFREFPFVLFGSFALVSGVMMFLTPETLGTKLPDTMEEAENLNYV